jgi:hypothetical protein
MSLPSQDLALRFVVVAIETAIDFALTEDQKCSVTGEARESNCVCCSQLDVRHSLQLLTAGSEWQRIVIVHIVAQFPGLADGLLAMGAGDAFLQLLDADAFFDDVVGPTTKSKRRAPLWRSSFITYRIRRRRDARQWSSLVLGIFVEFNRRVSERFATISRG